MDQFFAKVTPIRRFASLRSELSCQDASLAIHHQQYNLEFSSYCHNRIIRQLIFAVELFTGVLIFSYR